MAYHIGDRVRSRRESDKGTEGVIANIIAAKGGPSYMIVTDGGKIITRKGREIEEAEHYDF